MAYLPQLAFQPYVAPQQEMPVEEFNNLGVVLNKRYDENLAKWDELDAYQNQLELNEADSGLKSKAISDTRDILKSIREKGNWENSKLQVREVAKRLANDQGLAIGQKNFKKAQEQKEVENKMRMQGINLIDFNQDRFNQSTIDPVTGRARTLDYSGTEKLQDYDARRKSLFEGLQADGFDNKNSSPQFDKSTGMIYQVGSGSGARFVSAKKVKEIANNNLNNYLESAEGQQELKMLTTSNSMNAQPLSISDAKKQILSGIVNTGMTRVYSQTSNESSKSISHAGSFGQSAPPPPPVNREIALPINKETANPIMSSVASKLTLSSFNNLSIPEQKANIRKGAGDIFGSANDTGGEFIGEMMAHNFKKSYGRLNRQETEAMNNIGVVLGLKKQSSGQFSVKDLSKISKYAQDVASRGVASTVRTFEEEEIPQQNSFVANGTMRGARFLDPETGKAVDYKNLPSAQKKILEDKDTGKIQFTGIVNADNQYYDMMKADKAEKNYDGWLRPKYLSIGGKAYIVSSDISEVRKMDVPFVRTINQLTKANRYGIPVRIKGTSDGQEYITMPTRSNAKSPDGQPLYDIVDARTGQSQGAPVPLNSIAKSITDNHFSIKE